MFNFRRSLNKVKDTDTEYVMKVLSVPLTTISDEMTSITYFPIAVKIKQVANRYYVICNGKVVSKSSSKKIKPVYDNIFQPTIIKKGSRYHLVIHYVCQM